ncbi:hypothetical protein [Microlunatus antarcticus]|uniref:Uncharacterized membrane protein YhaH (DUF805 family) n=1 Tax=Microlunatus antarcticus TaxID=53388 RepID=A0A7W5P6F7_9ACTN|nr:hypothetical protein [Microlunatus antarcticus]MBB3326393.1 uncharacterized membrane protein YhaH (DUF805 family) [Microlunatus antarcticus]
MDEDGNVKNSTLIVGVAITLVLIVVGTLIAEAVAPHFVYWAFIPALIFAVVYINVHRNRDRRKRS